MGSIFSEAQSGYLEDTRALRVGDIVLVRINEKADAQGGATTNLSKDSKRSAGVESLLGLVPAIQKAYPNIDPKSLLEMQSNIYRGLGWAVMKAGGFEEKKGPDGFFQEFYWGDYFRAKVRWNDGDDEDFKRAVKEAVALAHDPAAAKLPGYIPAPKAP